MKKVTAFFAVVLLALGGFALFYQTQGATIAGPQGLCDSKSLRTMATDSETRGDLFNASLLRQAAEKCDALNGKALVGPAEATSSPTATASAKADTDIEEFLANRPVKTKTSTNAFGPKRAVLPSLKKKLMEDLTAKQAKAELLYVVEKVDRMQTADKALDLGIVAKNNDENQINDLTKQFVKDRDYWEDIRKKVADRIRELKPSIVTVDAGTVVGMNYATPGKIPQVGTKNVSFSYDTKWLVLKDANGKEIARYRLACHFQHGGGVEVKTPPGTTITPEGEVELLVNACRLVNGEWVVVKNVKHKKGDLPVDDAKCNPTSSPSPTPSETPSETPTPTPTPSCSTDNKVCETPVAPPTDRDKPTSEPSRSPETTPPTEPTKPATTVTPTVTAPGATKAPKPTEAAPTAGGGKTSEPPNKGDDDPDDPDPTATP